MPLDAHEVALGLWLGAYSPQVPAAFDGVLILAPASELPAPASCERCALSDRSPWSDLDFAVAESAADALNTMRQRVTRHADGRYAEGRRVVACCREGLNRSALVVGLALVKTFPAWAGASVLEHLRRVRGPRVLYNQQLADYLAAKT